MFVLQRAFVPALQLDGVTAEKQREGYDIARGDFVVEVEDAGAGFTGGVYYDADRFAPSTIATLSSSFLAALDMGARRPEARLGAIVRRAQGASRRPPSALQPEDGGVHL
jgi:hypothetical protein